MGWQFIILIMLLVYIGFDYGRLIAKNKHLQNGVLELENNTPTRYIMVGARDSQYITYLATLDIDAHAQAGVLVKYSEENKEKGIQKIVFENDDELIVYDYENAQVIPLTKKEINDYSQKIFFDYRLPDGAERAIIKQLGLLDYMVNIGICSEKSGGK